MKLLGVDPGLAACGLAILEILPGPEPKGEVVELAVVRTQPSDKRRHLRAADDTADRLNTIARALLVRLSNHPDLLAICVESQAIPFRAGRMLVKPSAISALGRVRGLLDAFGASTGLPVLEESAQQLKLLVTGRRDSSKAEMATALEARFPEVQQLWPTQKTLQEHAADALAATVAGLQSDTVRAALRARFVTLKDDGFFGS